MYDDLYCLNPLSAAADEKSVLEISNIRSSGRRRHLVFSWRYARYSCDQCDYKTTQKGYLKTHIDSVHGDVRDSCDQCDYKATQ